MPATGGSGGEGGVGGGAGGGRGGGEGERLGGGLKKPPARREVLDALRRHDAGGKGHLSRDEFRAAAQDIYKVTIDEHGRVSRSA